MLLKHTVDTCFGQAGLSPLAEASKDRWSEEMVVLRRSWATLPEGGGMVDTEGVYLEASFWGSRQQQRLKVSTALHVCPLLREPLFGLFSEKMTEPNGPSLIGGSHTRL